MIIVSSENTENVVQTDFPVYLTDQVAPSHQNQFGAQIRGRRICTPSSTCLHAKKCDKKKPDVVHSALLLLFTVSERRKASATRLILWAIASC